MTAAADRINLLAIDLTTAPDPLRSSLFIDRDELTVLLDRTRLQLSELELVVISSDERIELYGAGANWRRGFQHVLREVSARAQELEGFGSLRTIEIGGVAAAKHLMRVATGLESYFGAAELAMRTVDDAAQVARMAHTLGDDLATLFTCAAAAGARSRRETTFSSATATEAELELEVSEVDRIVEEELLAWQSWCARETRRVDGPSSASSATNAPSVFPNERTTVRPIKPKQSVA